MWYRQTSEMRPQARRARQRCLSLFKVEKRNEFHSLSLSLTLTVTISVVVKGLLDTTLERLKPWRSEVARKWLGGMVLQKSS